MFHIRTWQRSDTQSTAERTIYYREESKYRWTWRGPRKRRYPCRERRVVWTPEGARINALLERCVDDVIYDWERDEWGRLVNEPRIPHGTVSSSREVGFR